MICSKCGTVIEKRVAQCPFCHAELFEKGVPTVDFRKEGNEEATTVVRKKPVPLWFKWVSMLSVLALIIVTIAIVFLVI